MKKSVLAFFVLFFVMVSSFNTIPFIDNSLNKDSNSNGLSSSDNIENKTVFNINNDTKNNSLNVDNYGVSNNVISYDDKVISSESVSGFSETIGDDKLVLPDGTDISNSTMYAESFADISDWSAITSASYSTNGDVLNVVSSGTNDGIYSNLNLAAGSYQIEIRYRVTDGSFSLELKTSDGVWHTDVVALTSTSWYTKREFKTYDNDITQIRLRAWGSSTRYLYVDYIRIAPADRFGYQEDCSSTSNFGWRSGYSGTISSDGDYVNITADHAWDWAYWKPDNSATNAMIRLEYYAFLHIKFRSSAIGSKANLAIEDSNGVWHVITGDFEITKQDYYFNTKYFGNLYLKYLWIAAFNTSSSVIIDYIKFYSIANYYIGVSGVDKYTIAYVENGILHNNISSGYLVYYNELLLNINTSEYNVFNFSGKCISSQDYIKFTYTDYKMSDTRYLTRGLTIYSSTDNKIIRDYYFTLRTTCVVRNISFWYDNTPPSIDRIWYNGIQYNNESLYLYVSLYDIYGAYSVYIEPFELPSGVDVDNLYLQKVSGVSFELWMLEYKFEAGYYIFKVVVFDGVYYSYGTIDFNIKVSNTIPIDGSYSVFSISEFKETIGDDKKVFLDGIDVSNDSMYSESFSSVSNWSLYSSTSGAVGYSFTSDGDRATLYSGFKGSYTSSDYVMYKTNDLNISLDDGEYYLEFEYLFVTNASAIPHLRVIFSDGGSDIYTYLIIPSDTSHTTKKVDLSYIIKNNKPTWTHYEIWYIALDLNDYPDNVNQYATLYIDYIRIARSDQFGYQEDCSSTSNWYSLGGAYTTIISSDGDMINITSTGVSYGWAVFEPDYTTSTRSHLSLNYYPFVHIHFDSSAIGKQVNVGFKNESGYFYSLTGNFIQLTKTDYYFNMKVYDDYMTTFQIAVYTNEGSILVDFIKFYSIANFTISQSAYVSSNDVLYVDNGNLISKRTTSEYITISNDVYVYMNTTDYNVWNLSMSAVGGDTYHTYGYDFGTRFEISSVWGTTLFNTYRAKFENDGILQDFAIFSYDSFVLRNITFWSDHEKPLINKVWHNGLLYDNLNTTIFVNAYDINGIYEITLIPIQKPETETVYSINLTRMYKGPFEIWNVSYKFKAGYYIFKVAVFDGVYYTYTTLAFNITHKDVVQNQLYYTFMLTDSYRYPNTIFDTGLYLVIYGYFVQYYKECTLYVSYLDSNNEWNLSISGIEWGGNMYFKIPRQFLSVLSMTFPNAILRVYYGGILLDNTSVSESDDVSALLPTYFNTYNFVGDFAYYNYEYVAMCRVAHGLKLENGTLSGSNKIVFDYKYLWDDTWYYNTGYVRGYTYVYWEGHIGLGYFYSSSNKVYMLLYGVDVSGFSEGMLLKFENIGSWVYDPLYNTIALSYMYTIDSIYVSPNIAITNRLAFVGSDYVSFSGTTNLPCNVSVYENGLLTFNTVLSQSGDFSIYWNRSIGVGIVQATLHFYNSYSYIDINITYSKLNEVNDNVVYVEGYIDNSQSVNNILTLKAYENVSTLDLIDQNVQLDVILRINYTDPTVGYLYWNTYFDINISVVFDHGIAKIDLNKYIDQFNNKSYESALSILQVYVNYSGSYHLVQRFNIKHFNDYMQSHIWASGYTDENYVYIKTSWTEMCTLYLHNTTYSFTPVTDYSYLYYIYWIDDDGYTEHVVSWSAQNSYIKIPYQLLQSKVFYIRILSTLEDNVVFIEHYTNVTIHPSLYITNRMLSIGDSYVVFAGTTNLPFNVTVYENGTAVAYSNVTQAGEFAIRWNRAVGSGDIIATLNFTTPYSYVSVNVTYAMLSDTQLYYKLMSIILYNELGHHLDIEDFNITVDGIDIYGGEFYGDYRLNHTIVIRDFFGNVVKNITTQLTYTTPNRIVIDMITFSVYNEVNDYIVFSITMSGFEYEWTEFIAEHESATFYLYGNVTFQYRWYELHDNTQTGSGYIATETDTAMIIRGVNLEDIFNKVNNLPGGSVGVPSETLSAVNSKLTTLSNIQILSLLISLVLVGAVWAKGYTRKDKNEVPEVLTPRSMYTPNYNVRSMYSSSYKRSRKKRR